MKEIIKYAHAAAVIRQAMEESRYRALGPEMQKRFLYTMA